MTGEQPQEADEATRVVAVDDRPRPGMGREVGESRPDGVDRPPARERGSSHGPQRRRPTRACAAQHREVPVAGVPPDDRPALEVGDVAERDGQRRDLGEHRATPGAGMVVARARRADRRDAGPELAVARRGAGRTRELREVVLPDPVGQGGQPRRRRRAQAGALCDVAGRGHDPGKPVDSRPGRSRTGRGVVVVRGGVSPGQPSCDAPRGSAARTGRRDARRRPGPGALHRERRFGTPAQDEPPRRRRRDERRER